MYSLYRAWLSLGSCPIPTLPAPPLNVAGAPDVVLHVGPGMTQFSAHRVVLSTHSGFFKAALLNHTDASPIVVPNVNVDEFSSLLTFMYTGYLDLNLNNIYNIILATHILHMPRALEICRSYLLQNQPENHPAIIKPIPSRKTALPTQQIVPPTFSLFQKSESTIFKAVTNEKHDEIPSTSKIPDTPITENTSNITPKHKSKKKIQEPSSSSTTTEKFIIDIACCDGPVRFHRVLNKYYNSENCEKTPELPHDENESSNSNEMFTCLYCNHTFKSQYCYQKHARRHLNPVTMDSNKPTVSAPKEQKRDLKLLDMNVQYYPCKTCGSKFPSYYFVHKHRKLCHAEEMSDSSNKNNEMVPEQNESNSSGSAIDVEAINTDQ